ncbi:MULTISPECIES: hypothetical protein [Vagococcus]|uniref:Uncharacterized protein n=1 Tax=Vagococcus fluvialis bH819 TaxID=1255619 RepID=A0A1X6WPT6_9ENTE|nr:MULTISPECIES: hypothetical protein [Vagococcus]SLM86324.1 hypothetical protein FM121_09555 [Vagococcus fluvialis bH819]HCM88976.1 hypothetical protein [Vagococcus sp.]
MKLSTAISYRFKYQMKSAAIFFAYFIFFAVILPLVGIFMAGGVDQVVKSDAIIPGIVFMMILAFIGISTDFKLFIQNGMSRLNIYLASLISNAVLSAVFAFALMLFPFLLNKVLPTNFKFTLFLTEFYTDNNVMLSFLLLFVLLLAASSLGTIAGTFNDRVTGVKKLVVIGLLIVIPILVSMLIQIVSPSFRANIFSFLQKMLGLNNGKVEVLPFMITLITLFIIFSIITYLMNINREIKRVNG